MSQVEKLRKKAAEHEAKRQTDKAIATYLELFKLWDNGEDADIDVALYNRVGDMLVREGNVGDAVSVWEKAVDYYSESGFHNNAIALCNKILRNSPGRASVYYKLGRISAQKGFKGDAKKNFLEYADRMQKSNNIDEAFRALKEFADLCPDEDDIRQMLADQLAKLGRNDEALEQLQLLYERYESTGDAGAAAATVERMKAIDPAAEPKQGGATRARQTTGLVFIDLDTPGGARKSSMTPRSPDLTPASRRKSAIAGLPLIATEEEVTAAPPAPVVPMVGLESTAVEPPVEEVPVVKDVTFGASFGTDEPGADTGTALEGLEITSLDVAAEGEHRVTSSLSSVGDATFGTLVEPGAGTGEPSSDSTSDLELEPLAGLEPTSADEPPSSGMMDLPLMDLDVETPAPEAEPVALPTLDVEMPTIEEAPAIEEARAVEEAPAFEELAAVEEMPAVEEVAAAAPAAASAPAEAPIEPPRRAGRSTMSVLAQSVDSLRDRVTHEAENWQLHRQLGEALLEDGNREGGLEELERAMIGFERDEDLESARSVADEIIRLNPLSVRHHQKRVELAIRMNDRPRLVEAYLELADALFRAGQAEKSKAVYQRVLELAPDDVRAQAALSAFVETEPVVEKAAAQERRPTSAKRYTIETQVPAAAIPPKPAPNAPTEEGDFVSLEDWLREDEAPKSTRMVVEEKEPTGDENADFNDMLRKFKQGVAQNVDEEDHESHYDLGIAYKEMGLVEEAIAEFQKALRGTEHRVRTYEALGQCFMEKGQPNVAMTILQRALGEPGAGDDQLVGVLYLLGVAAEDQKMPGEAVKFFQRVFAVDINFRDVQDRMRALEHAAR